jgi:hypothetical protein
MQLLPSLLSGLTSVCATFPDPRKGRGGNIAELIKARDSPWTPSQTLPLELLVLFAIHA